MIQLIVAIAVGGALVAGEAGLKVRVGGAGGHMDERGPTTWLVEGKKVPVDKTYFQADGKDLTFVVEWRCDCRQSKPMSHEQALAVSRAVLWHAVEGGEVSRTAFTKLGSGRKPPNRIRGVISYEAAGKQEKVTVTVDKLDALFDWTWTIGDQSYRVFGPGYYFDSDARRLYFTVKWHARALCEQLEGITDERAARLAMPLLKEVAARKLFKYVPRVGRPDDDGPDLTAHEVDAIGVEIGCPDPTCAGAVDCPARGYRVSRTLTEIAGAR